MKPTETIARKWFAVRLLGCLTLVAFLENTGTAQNAAQKKVQGNSASIGTASSVTHMGFTEPEQDILVGADELGRLESVEVEIGDSVTAGQVLGKLESSLQEIAVELARFQLQMTGELEAAQAEVELNRSRTIQLRQLVSDQMARPDELARAETDLRVAVARHSAILEQTELRKLELRRHQLQLDRRLVRAPTSGVIAEVYHHSGEYITPADPAIVRLMVVEKLYAVFNVPVEDAVAIAVGDVARVFLISTSKSLTAPVTSVSPNIDAESGTIEVRVKLNNPDGKMLSGDQCTMQILYGQTLNDTQAALQVAPTSKQQETSNR